MNATEIIGWASSVILVLTIAKQVYKQWQEGQSEGVSKWLFIGQMAASIGFTVYSWLVGNMVFVVTNSLMLLNALAGFGIVRHHRKRKQQQHAPKSTGGNLEAGQA
jgi:MtN3 and saliva related transmembrane protein